MNISYNASDASSRQNIILGSTIVININEVHLSGASSLNVEAWANLFIHELFHPYFADVNGDDHDRVIPAAAEAVKQLFLENYEKTLGADPQKAIFGSRFGDALNGGDNDDSIAGMEGNDLLVGGSGSNLIYGGIGQDHLVSAGVNDLLSGGLEADFYEVTAASLSPFVREDGGVDRIRLDGMLADYTITRYGDSLMLSGLSSGRAHEIIIDGWYTSDARRIETFEFAEGAYAASYIEYVAAGQMNNCYDESGRPILCGVSATPIVLDLQGDGISFIEAEQSGIRLDVDGDGTLDRVGWITPEDGLLLFDRNGDGQFTDFSELTFTSDMLGAASDLEGLLAHDDDHDGFITGSDAIFGELLVWVDANMNGRSDNGEIASLQDYGITGFDLEIMARSRADRDAPTSQVLGWSDVQGQTAAVAVDAAFRYLAGEPSCGCSRSRMPPGEEFSGWETQISLATVSEYDF